jgi:hypothetical protein
VPRDQRDGSILRFLDLVRYRVPNEINEDILNNAGREASRYFRNGKREYLKDKINELATNSKNTNIRHLYRGINYFKRDCQPRYNSVKDENGDLLADSHNILKKGKNLRALGGQQNSVGCPGSQTGQQERCPRIPQMVCTKGF